MFKKVAPNLVLLDQTFIENKSKDMQTQLDTLKQENLELKGKYEQDMKSIQEQMNKQFAQVMEMIQENPKLARVKPDVLTKKRINKINN
jgi:hypothetical protein